MRTTTRLSKFFTFLPIVVLCLASIITLSACQTAGGYAQTSGRTKVPVFDEATPSQGTVSTIETAAVSTPAQTPVASHSRTVRVGLLLPLSGPHAQLGQAMLNAAQLALFNVGSSELILIPEDTHGTSEGARQAAQNVVNQDADIILGPLLSESVRAIKPVVQRANINAIAFSTDWSLAGNHIFLIGFMPFDQIDRVLDYASKRNIQSVGTLIPDNAYGHIVSSIYRETAARKGLRTTANASFNPQDPYLDPVVKNLTGYHTTQAASLGGKPAPFDAVLLPLGGQTAIQASTLLSQYNAPPNLVKRLGTGLMDDPSLFYDRSLNGAWFAASDPALRQNFERSYQNTYGEKPPRLSTLAYDATALAAVLTQHGFKQGTGPLFNESSLKNPNGFSGVDGVFRFNRNGVAERGLAVLEIQNGTSRVIDPAPKSFQR